MKPIVPSLGLPEVDGQEVGDLLGAAKETLRAKSTAEILRGLGFGGDSGPALAGVGELLQGVGQAYKGLGEASQQLIQTLLQQQQNRGDGGMTALLLLLLLQQQQQQKSGGSDSGGSDSAERWIALVDRMLEPWKEMVKDLKEQSRSAGPFDGALLPVMQQTAQQMAQRLLQPPSPDEEMERHLKLIERMRSHPLLSPQTTISPEALKAQELYYGHLQVVGQQETERAKLEARRETMQRLPEIVEALGRGLGQGAAQVAGALGMLPMRQPPAEAVEAAQRAAAAGATQGE